MNYVAVDTHTNGAMFGVDSEFVHCTRRKALRFDVKTPFCCLLLKFALWCCMVIFLDVVIPL